MDRLTRLAKRAAWALLFALAALVLTIEVGLRLVRTAGVETFRHGLDPIGEQMEHANIQPHPYLAYANRPDWVRPEHLEGEKTASHNSLGFRGPETTWEKPEGTLRIVCLGGSSTYGFGPSSDETTWPARLEHHLARARPDLAVEVINCGTRGYSTFESLINLSIRVLDFEPDVVVVYHTINDVRCALYPGVVPDNSHWRAVWKRSAPTFFERRLGWSYSYLIARRYLTDYLEERGDLGSYVIVDYRPLEDPYAKREVPKRGLLNFERNLESIVALSRANGAQVALVTQGLDRGDLHVYASRFAQMRAVDLMTAILKRVAEEHGTALVDAAAVLDGEAARQREERGTPDEPGDDSVFTHDVHLTDEGADLLARTVAQGLLEQGCLP